MERLANKFAFCVACRENPSIDFFSARNRTTGLYIGSRMEENKEFTDQLANLIDVNQLAKAVTGSNELRRLESTFTDWILSHKYNTITGLEAYEADYSEGSTQAFDSFYFRHRTRRFRCFVGEYFYHIKTWQANNVNWSWINDLDDLQVNDAIVLSIPFCDTVNKLPNTDQLLERCSQLGIPVLLDLCYYIISHDLYINIEHECIDTVAFSLSKAWPISTARIGMRYTRKNIFDGQKLHSSIGYNNNLGAYIGNQVIDNFTPDWIYIARSTKYKAICDILQLAPTNSVNFAIGDHSWKKYSRKELLKSYKLDYDPDMFVNRICLNKIYQHWDLFRNLIKNETKLEIQ